MAVELAEEVVVVAVVVTDVEDVVEDWYLNIEIRPPFPHF